MTFPLSVRYSRLYPGLGEILKVNDFFVNLEIL
jgi:hypothetical protein